MPIIKQKIKTDRLEVAYLRKGNTNSPTLLLVHGNASGCGFYLPLMNKLENYYDVIAIDLAGYGQTEARPIKGETGLKDWADDLDSFVRALNIEKFALLGWSLGGGVVMKYAIEYSQKLTKLLLISPMSPYGFGGTYDEDGKMIDKDGRGSTGGFANIDFVKALIDKDKSNNPNGPTGVMYKTYFKPGFKLDAEIENMFTDEMFEMKVGPDYYPGDYKKSFKFPYVLPGTRGVNNTLAPQYANVSQIANINVKPDIIWFRGDSDMLVSDCSVGDLAYLGKLGIIPKYPGEDEFPIQPMVKQTRYVLEKYKQNGGNYYEYEIKNAAHSCHIEQEDEFIKIIKQHI